MTKITYSKLKNLDNESLINLAIKNKINYRKYTNKELILLIWDKIKKINISCDSNIQRYFNELTDINNKTKGVINKSKLYKPISKADALEMNDTPENRDILLKSILKLVVKISKYYIDQCNSVVSLDDIIQSGNIGALIAVDIHMKRSREERLKYDFEFSTMASKWILKYIRLEIKRSKNNLENNIDETIQIEDDSLTNINIEDIENINVKSKALFSNLSSHEKNILFMSWGIGLDDVMTMRDISKYYKKSLGWVHGVVTKAEHKISDKKEIISDLLSCGYDLAKVSEFSLNRNAYIK